MLWRYVQRTNLRARALHRGGAASAISRRLLAPRRRAAASASSARRSTTAIRRLRDERHKLIDASRFYEAVLDDAPIALLTVDGDGRVELANKAARRLFVRHKGVRVEDFARLWRRLRRAR